MDFTSKVVIITGASSGIGAIIALEFARAGANVVVVGRIKQNLEKIAEKCRTFHGKEQLVVAADVTSEEDLNMIIEETVKKFKKIDVLINNAAAILMRKFEDSSLEDYDKTMATNVRPAFHLIKLATSHLVESKGNVINISSIASNTAASGLSLYCTSKAALDQLTKCIALELAPKGVRVNCVNPGATLTQKVEQILSPDYAPDVPSRQIHEKNSKITPLGKCASSEEVAALAMFLASDAAKSITGAQYVIDNGSRLAPLRNFV